MPRIALVIGGQVSRIENRASQPPNIAHKSVEWKPVVGNQPNFDPLIEVLEGPTYSVGAGNVTEEWSVRSLTAQEITDSKAAAINAINGARSPILRAFYNLDKRLRVLEGANAITFAQFKAGLPSVLP